MSRISKLPVILANQIAAGEVIERPASVVKELLENSIDAGATRIDITIKKSGRELIQITDNGDGIHRDDLILALDRFATSKIEHLVDLNQIKSLGFRGEALSSIAAICELSITSRISTIDNIDNGWQVQTDETNNVLPIIPAAHPLGTSIKVANLFFNTPGRRKFLKSDKTEWLHIQETIKRISLSVPHIQFYCEHNNVAVIKYLSSDPSAQQRVSEICGANFLKKSVPITIKRHTIGLSGWVSLPHSTRGLSDRQYFFLNGRIVRSQPIQHAVRSAYGDLLHMGRFPCYVLFMEIPADQVDVNVHPSKYEVRFADPRQIHDIVYAAVRASLDDGMEKASSVASTDGLIQQSPGISTAKIHQHMVFSDGRFLLAEIGNETMLLDIFTVRERITFLQLLGMYNKKGITSTPVLAPLVIPVEEKKIQQVPKIPKILASLSIVVSENGINLFRVREIPSLLQEADINALVTNVINALPEDDMEKLLGLMATHVNDGMARYLSSLEVEGLLEQFEHYRKSHTESFSKGVYRHLQIDDLRKWLQ